MDCRRQVRLRVAVSGLWVESAFQGADSGAELYRMRPSTEYTTQTGGKMALTLSGAATSGYTAGVTLGFPVTATT